MAPTLKGCGTGATASPEDDSKAAFRLLFESERGSDVTLLVGSDGSQERIPAHSWVLAHSNDYFRTLLAGPLRDTNKNTFIFADDRPNSFINLIRWLYGCSCSPEGTQSALDTMDVAIKYLCPELVHHVVSHLSRRLRPTSVLQVLAWGYKYANGCEGIEPSAPPFSEIVNAEKSPSSHQTDHSNSTIQEHRSYSRSISVSEYSGSSSVKSCSRTRRHSEMCDPSHHYKLNNCLSSFLPGSSFAASSSSLPLTNTDPTYSCRVLVPHCLSHIDSHSSEVLSSEKLESLPAAVLTAVLSRNSLSVPNETLVLDALFRWSNAECRRQHQPMSLRGRRKVLGNMLTLPRLLTMTSRSLSKMEDLYETHEIEYVRARVRRDTCVPPVPELFHGHLDQVAQPRSPKSQRKGSTSTVPHRKFNKKELMMNMFAVIALVID